MLLHHISKEQVAELERIFAFLTEDGWVIPEWINLLRDNPLASSNKHLHVVIYDR